MIDCVQNTEEWRQARLGVITASMFHKIVTPTKCEYSKQADDYENALASEIITGDPSEDFGGTYWTNRGHELEPDAIDFYKFQNDLEITHGGFVLSDCGGYGASPDAFVGEEGLLEIKCLSPKEHFWTLINPSDHKDRWPQLQGQLMVTERAWVDILFYHPKMKPSIKRIERDEDYISKLRTAVEKSVLNIKEKVSKYNEC